MAYGDATARVQELIEEFGISERTAWRWLAKLKDPDSPFHAQFLCRACGADLLELDPNATSRRSYCDDRCRTYGRRRRQARLARERAAVAARPPG